MADPKTFSDTPPLREDQGAGVPSDDKRSTIRNEQSDTPEKPMSGAVRRENEPLKNKLANRNPGARQAGITPRPTDKPITGGSR